MYNRNALFETGLIVNEFENALNFNDAVQREIVQNVY